MEKKKKLTVKQAKFTKEYLKDGNGTQAAIKAGYSENSAKEIASQNLTKPGIREEIERVHEKLGLTAERVLNNIMEIAEFDMSEAYDELGNMKPFADMPKHIRKHINSVKTFNEMGGTANEKFVTGEIREVRFSDDKIKANELLGKHLKLFTEKIEHSGEVKSVVTVEPFDLEERLKQIKGQS